MKPGLLSTTEVSKMLQVNESTVKRWTDKGSLRCIKTPGGHRKYKMKDIVEFMDSTSYDVTDLLVPGKEHFSKVNVSTDYAILTKDFSVMAGIFFNTMLEGNRENTFQYLNLLYANRITLAEIYDHIVFPAFSMIGSKWKSGKLGIEQEHLASNTAMHSILRLQNHISKKPNHGGIAVCACLENEFHEIGIMCVNNILEAHGWTTYFLGTNLPAESLIDAVENYVPAVVCVSSTTPKSNKQLIGDCALLYETTQIIGAKLIVGGIAATDTVRKKITADAFPNSIAELLAYVQTLPVKK